MFRTSPAIIAVISIAPFACTGTNAGGYGTQTTGEASGSGTPQASEGAAPTTTTTSTVGTSLPSTSETSNEDTTQVDTANSVATQADTGGELSGNMTEVSTTEDSTTEGSTETDGEISFKVGLELKTLCSPNFDVMCGVTPDDMMVCWGDVGDASFQVPPGKVKGVSGHCFLAILESGDLHRVMNIPLKPLALPKGPFVLAGGDYPYGCAMAANNAMTCWAAEGYQALEEPPPGPYLALGDARDSSCQMCGIRGDGSLVCWKKPIEGDWDAHCGGIGWGGLAAGTYTKFIGNGGDYVTVINNLGQLIWFTPGADASTYVDPAFASGGFVEANILVGLRQSGELLYFENSMGNGVPVLPGAYVTFQGTQYNGCAIRQADSRVVCWGEGEHGQFDPPTE